MIGDFISLYIKGKMEDSSEWRSKKKRLPIIELHSKVVISLIVALVWFTVTKGRPPNLKLLEGVSEIETTMEDIFETTIAIERRRFRKRIIEESKGYWNYIPYANQNRWIDLEISLTTRIGFDLSQGIPSVGESGRLVVDVFEPSILSKAWTTEIVDKADNMFNKWDIQDYRAKESQLLEAIALAESQNLLEEFKNSPAKMGELANRLEQKLHRKFSFLGKPI